MAESGQAQSVLQLDKVLFDKIEFKRLGFPADKEFEVTISSSVSQKQGADVYKSDEELGEERKNELISRNTIAILMPYLRSQVSLLTAQPGVECVVLPPFNINKMLEEK